MAKINEFKKDIVEILENTDLENIIPMLKFNSEIADTEIHYNLLFEEMDTYDYLFDEIISIINVDIGVCVDSGLDFDLIEVKKYLKNIFLMECLNDYTSIIITGFNEDDIYPFFHITIFSLF